MFNNYFGITDSPSLEFINFLIEITPIDIDDNPDNDFLDFIYGEGQ